VATGSSAGAGDLDVGTCLQPFFSYSEEEKAQLVTWPLPPYMMMWIAGQHILVAKGKAEEKKKHDELKANPAGQRLKGAMPVGPTHCISLLVMSDIELPKVFLGCLVQKMPIPLRWWTNSNLMKVINNLHWLLWRELTIKGKKIMIIETGKAEIIGNAMQKIQKSDAQEMVQGLSKLLVHPEDRWPGGPC
jgi:hypothetical protein